MKLISKVFLFALFISLSFSCSDDDEAVIETNTIVDVAIENNLSSLVAAVTRAELVTTLSSNGNFTVLAPTNTAFQTFLQTNGYNSVNDVPVEVLKNILMNHVITGELKSTDLTTGYQKTNAISAASNTEMSIYVNVGAQVKFNGTSTVQIPNVEADNGIVHVVDAVIDLPSIVTFAVADPNFESLELALTRESDFNYVSTLSTKVGTNPAPFTVFAPTNDAFASLIGELSNVNSLGDIPKATLESTLNTHVIAGFNYRATGLSNNMTLNTLGGQLTVDLTGSVPKLVDPNSRTSDITATDVQANNGVIHAIRTVVLE
ncbi:fasciclin domain-containing protein [Polaribacter porphyrae]|uniref:Fasciclin n=1 Tax=Polaribacter porphyrae TaxID=1137780 RepID=A0A2S7WNJ0_9FLAO|nr:fasciclin domain-containing protein [Polaribacter porphyrae]PQJ79169.1 fasciclin [Polaribacter porphyrae]